MGKRKILDEACKENQNPEDTVAQKKVKGDDYEQKVDTFLNTFSQRFDVLLQNAQEKINANFSALNQSSANMTSHLNATLLTEIDQSTANANLDVTQKPVIVPETPCERSDLNDKCTIDELMSILSKSEQFSAHMANGKLVKIPATPTLCVSYYDLVQMACLNDNNDLMSQVKDFIVKTLQPECLKQLLNELTINYRRLKSSKLLIELSEYRLKWIDDFIKNEPKFSWHMMNPKFTQCQAYYPDLSTVVSFLQSDQIQMNYHCGNSILFARRFVNQYSDVRDGYSCTMIPRGSGANAFIEITKNRGLYENQLRIYNEKKDVYEIEQKKLADFLGELFFVAKMSYLLEFKTPMIPI